MSEQQVGGCERVAGAMWGCDVPRSLMGGCLFGFTRGRASMPTIGPANNDAKMATTRLEDMLSNQMCC